MAKKRSHAMQAAKVENKGWMRARVQQGNMNLTVPSGKAYKRPKAGGKGRDW